MHAGFSYADPNGGVHGAFAIISALFHRAKTGEGQYIDMSQWECAMELLAEGILEYTMNGREPERVGNRDPFMAPHGIFKCLDRPEKMMDITIDQLGIDRLRRRCGVGAAAPVQSASSSWPTMRASIRWRRASSNEDELEAVITEMDLDAADGRRGRRTAGGGCRGSRHAPTTSTSPRKIRI